jgi:hypothetical protein
MNCIIMTRQHRVISRPLDGLLPVFHENTKPSARSLYADVICAMEVLGRRQ